MVLSSRALARSWPNGFSMTTRRQASPRASARPERFELLADQRERAGWDRQVEREVAAGAALVLQVVHGVGKQVEGGRVVEGARHEPEPLGEVAPDVLAERGPRMVTHGLVDDLPEVLVGPVTAGEPHEGEARRQQAPVGEVVDRRHQLLARRGRRSPRTSPCRTGRRSGAAAGPARCGGGWCPPRPGLGSCVSSTGSHRGLGSAHAEHLLELGQSGVVLGQVQLEHGAPVRREHLPRHRRPGPR